MKKMLTLACLLLPIYFFAQQHYLIVGTYTDASKSEGIYVYKFNSANGSATPVSVIKASNPSYLCVSPDQQFIYAVNESADSTIGYVGGWVSSYSFNASNGRLTEISQQQSGGKHPCYVSVDKTGAWVTVGNYSSGTIGLFSTNNNGVLKPASQIIQHSGKSVNAQRQEGPHVHSNIFSADNRYLFVPDLGIDKIMHYSFDAAAGKLTAATQPFSESAAGSGPRHFEFHPNNKFAYLMEEMTGTVKAFTYHNGQLKQLQTISSHPADYTGAKGSADIHVSPDGKFLYCSNRGESNTIAIFSVNRKTGKLKAIGYQSVLGKTPRNFNFDPTGNYLLVGNQNSDEIVIFKRDTKTGLLTDSGQRITVGKPVCLKWVTVQ
ncbi:MAG: lactonase family protein [Flavihumibacter sp.]|nr:lactonase family protein [Flavihumibacter sp.]